MKFEIGKTYIFRNLRTEESNDFQKGDDYVYETLVWTGGTWTITIENEEALETLMDAQIKDDPPTFEFEEGAYVGDSYDWSLDDCDSDGWTINLSENSDYNKSDLDEKLNSDFHSGEDYLLEEGWDNVGGDFLKTEIVFEGEE
tara:strand:- start:2939 stop:3367 length:429 start_codon:yes stop_codon:yes gene_type:complete